jgi:hypothetical protein
MSWLEFIASLVRALAWPIVVLLIAFIFRKKITELLSERITRLRAGPLELEWERQVSETQAELEEAGATPPATNDLTDPAMRALAERSPSAAVVEAFAQIEHALRSLATSWLPDEDTDRLGGLRLARLLQQHDVLPEETVRAVEGLTVLRNLSAHGRAGDLTVERAVEYLALAQAVLFAIDQTARRQRPEGPN